MKDNIPAKERAYSYEHEMRKALSSLGIYTIAYNWANHKKTIG